MSNPENVQYENDIDTLSGDTVPNSPGSMAAMTQRYDPEPTTTTTTAPFVTNEDGEILRILPTGPAARIAFNELAQRKIDGGLDSHHAQFIHIQGRNHLSSGEGYDESESGDLSSSTTEAKEESMVYHGYYRVNFKSLPASKGPGWVLGKGLSNVNIDAQNVDILLAAPQSKARRHLAAAHAFLRLHPTSGAWMIRTNQLCKTVPKAIRSHVSTRTDAHGITECNHEVVYLDGVPMRHDAYRALIAPRTSLILGGLHYSIEFCIDSTEKEKTYSIVREAFFKGLDKIGPGPEVSGIPFTSDIKTTHAIFRRGLGQGTFGTVHDGYEPITGEPRAVKKLSLKSTAQRIAIRDEIKLHQRFDGNIGIVKIYGWCNAFNEQDLNTAPPFDVYLIFEKGISFADYAWSSSQASWTLRKLLCKQLLAGLSVLHVQGCMHRDITPMNILYFPHQPYHAALCDFGKLCDRTQDTNTALAAWRWLPPEIVPNNAHLYDQKIDMWMLGLALICCWFPVHCPRHQLRYRRHAEFIKELDDAAAREPAMECMGLAKLLGRMMEWEPAARPTADQALNDPCLAEVDESELKYLSGHAVATTSNKHLRDMTPPEESRRSR